MSEHLDIDTGNPKDARIAHPQSPSHILHSLHSIDVGVGEIGVTVRLGYKWATLPIGKSIYLCSCSGRDHEIVGEAEVVGIWIGLFHTLPAKLIEQEHEKSSRMYSCLMKSMKKVYGAKFSENETVTALSYRRTK